ncbi:Hypothetical Protein SiL_0860 [Sulfolobus islandicus LAL14/1]|uniref:Uncharacterized protein n=1 Tax=Saccharolobus islandicus LAL14/1 TaxID=1241935 RepID=M9U5M8_SACIS|nr:Hypothetical Protein SiL_0860 [Sulfolobus islandicus LAL14/1]
MIISNLSFGRLLFITELKASRMYFFLSCAVIITEILLDIHFNYYYEYFKLYILSPIGY